MKKLVDDPGFAKFIAKQLCKAHKGDIQAIKCIDSYFEPGDDELEDLCIPKPLRDGLIKCKCTDTRKLLLIDVIAHGISGTRKR